MMPASSLAHVAFVLAAIAAALAPLARGHGAPTTAQSAASFPGWPATYEGRRLTELPMSAREQAFGQDFPGLIGRFSDGRREIIVRYVSEATRRLHPAADCLRGVGYTITPKPLRKAPSGALMSCLRAERNGQALTVCEVISNGHGEHWPDVSAWYWTALTGGAKGPWWSFVVAEAE